MSSFIFHTTGFQPFTTSDSQPQKLPQPTAGGKRFGHKKKKNTITVTTQQTARSVLRSCTIVIERPHVKRANGFPIKVRGKKKKNDVCV